MIDEDDEQLLRDLGRHARAQERDPEALRLERLCRGELASEERAELEAAASAAPELATRVQAHLPLSPAVRAQIAARVLATVRADQAGVAKPSRRSSPVVRALWLAAPLSAAAGFFLWMASTRSPTAPLPHYSLEVTGGQAELRGPTASAEGPGAPLRVGPSTELTLVLRPATEVHTELSAAVFLVPAAGDLVPWPAQVAKASSGALRVALAPPPLPVATGAQARIVVAHAKLLQEEGASIAREEPAQAHEFQRFVLELAPALQP